MKLSAATKNALLLLLREEHTAWVALQDARGRSGEANYRTEFEAWVEASRVLRSMQTEAYDTRPVETWAAAGAEAARQLVKRK